MLQVMRKLYSQARVTQCAILLTAVCDMCGLLQAVPTSSHDLNTNSVVIKDKIETFKMDILTRLGYDRPPPGNMTRSIDEKRRMIREYQKYIQDRNDLYGHTEELDDEAHDNQLISNTLHTLQYKGGSPARVSDGDWQAKDAIRVYFSNTLKHSQTDHTKEMYVNNAKLRIKFAKVKPENLKDKLTVDKVIRINVYQILSIANHRDYRRTLLDSKLVSLTGPSLESFEVANAVRNWVNDNVTNLGLELATDSQDINDILEIDMSHSDLQHTGTFSNTTMVPSSPTLDIYAQERDILTRVKRRADQRRKRRRNICRRSDGGTECCRYPIRISFADIGWDSWIVAPTEYRGYYCAGSCPYRHKMANNFAGIKALLHEKHPDKVPAPCCVATKLAPFTILHYDYEGKYQFSDYPDLVVQQCKCG